MHCKRIAIHETESSLPSHATPQLARERVQYLKLNPNATNTKIPTMFDAMLSPDRSKGQVTPSERDMIADGCLMIGAGTDTTANALGLATWHITRNLRIHERLVRELTAEMPNRDDTVDSTALEGEGFEYLRAVVKETLRLAFGVPGRMPRRVPKGGATFSGKFVPYGVSISDLDLDYLVQQ